VILEWITDTKETKHGKWDKGDRIDTKLHGIPYKIALEWKKKKYVKEIRLKRR